MECPDFHGSVIYSIFLPLRLSTMWFYVGLPATLIGLVGSVMTVVNWADTPAGTLVTRGLLLFKTSYLYN
jgi:hypothetical protein